MPLILVRGDTALPETDMKVEETPSFLRRRRETGETGPVLTEHSGGRVWFFEGPGSDRDAPDGDGQIGSCYLKCLETAEERGAESILLPLFSACGASALPAREALSAASRAIRGFLEHSDLTVYLRVPDRSVPVADEELLELLRREGPALPAVKLNVGEPDEDRARNGKRAFRGTSGIRADVFLKKEKTKAWTEDEPGDGAMPREKKSTAAKERKTGPENRLIGALPGKNAREEETDGACLLAPSVFADGIGACDTAREDVRDGRPFDFDIRDEIGRELERMDEGFPAMLLRLIDKSGMTDAECYRRANVDRKLFNKIKNVPGYHPRKYTVLALAMALRTGPEETARLLRLAGYALSGASIGDRIVQLCMNRGIYDVDRVNALLFEYDQELLGSSVWPG